ncbi:lipopolysaccharide biosynthesis protein [Lishizhenia sp.]|uniref:lipopolysaccharide biosynthesis protein n=1 Tax=Lishizhenia sp. TaxID=2497594 RepID=UPI00299E9C5E|nr:oligosaccharide flippase family protein [Lishizhenia sp.]MDX1445046.1 oligosaccharide flippase family protein [Lishizhenia sp.]
MLKRINLKSELVKSVVLLTSGTVLAQLINMLLTPVITRLFSPDELGELGYFVRWATFVSSVASARYELAISLPKSHAHGFQIFRIALQISSLTLLLVLVGGGTYYLFSGMDGYTLFFVVSLVLACFGIIFRMIGTNWAIKTKSFKRISASKITEALGVTGFKIFAGLMNWGVVGLIIATVLGIFASAILFVINFFKERKNPDYKSSKAKRFVLMREYVDFPKVNLPHIIIDTGKDLLMAYLIVELFDKATFGSYDHSFRMLRVPLMFIGASIGQVFFQRASESFAAKKEIYPLLKRTTILLTLLSLVPFGLVFVFGEQMFFWVFGEEWGESGKIAEAIAPWLMINFIASPISTIPLVIKKQATFFWLGLGASLIQLIGFGLLPFISVFNNYLEYFNVVGWSMAVFLLFTVIYKLKLVKEADVRNNA